MFKLIKYNKSQMIGCGLLCFIVSITAAGTNVPAANPVDQEIIRNLEFYENLEMLEAGEPEDIANLDVWFDEAA